jgi:hypothetical protein
MTRRKTWKSEDAIQSECYVWFNNTHIELRGLLFAVPNGGARTALQGKIFKMTGVVPGVSDMLFIYKGKVYCFELKNKFGEQSEKQIAWQKKVEKQNVPYYLIRDLNTFKDIINSIIKNNG